MQDHDPAEERLRSLRDLRGPDLVSALIKELSELYRHVDQLQREMAAYRDYQAARDRWLMTDTAQRVRIQMPKSVAIDASQMLHPRQGFYGMEGGGKGTPFSWTGPSRNFSFDIFVDRFSGADLELRAVSCINFERQKDIKLLVNGETVVTTVTKSGPGLVLKAAIPACDDDRGTNLVFSVPEVLPPAESKDGRMLGIAFQSLSVNARSDAAGAAKNQRSDDIVVTLTRGVAGKRADDDISPAPTATDVAVS